MSAHRDIGYRSHGTASVCVSSRNGMHGIPPQILILSAHFSPRAKTIFFPKVPANEGEKKRDLIEFYTFQELELGKAMRDIHHETE